MVTFEISGPWRSDASRRTLATGGAGTPLARLTEAGGLVGLSISAVLFLTGAFFARQNLRIGRGDRRGATRLALFGGAAAMGSWLFAGRGFVPMYAALGFTLFMGSFVWVIYVAVEPFVRRRWPAMLVAWIRVLAGNVRDPVVGRDMLIGCAIGVAGSCLTALNRVVAWQSGNPFALLVPDWFMLNGTSPFIGAVFAQFAAALFVSLFTLFLLFVLRYAVRSDWIALPLFALLAGGARIGGITSWASVPVLIAGGALRTFALVRIGLVAAIIDAFVWTLFASSPMTLQTSAWYSSAGYVSLGIVGAIAVYGFKTALGGRPVLDRAAIAD